jgi:WD40 repeat protein
MYHTRFRALPLIIGLLTASAPGALLAVTPSFWTTSTFNEFSKGTLKGLTLNSEGRISLSPKFDSVFDTDQALIWSAVFDTKKNLYVGTGHDGKVFKVDVNGTSSVYFDAAELDVLALALDSEQTLFVATSPDGKIYRVSGEGKATVFFDPEDKFIWDMKFDKKGNLFVATGNKGRIYRVSKDGKGETFYDSGQANILCLAIDEQGNVIAGSDPDGYLYRISPEGKPFVLYDSSMREIHEVQIDSQGNIYFIGINASPTGAIPQSKANLPEGAPSDSITVSVSVASPTERSQAEEPVSNFRAPVARLGRRESGNLRSGIYRVSKDNHIESLWISDSETFFGLNLRPDGKILLSTGNKGRIYLLDDLKKPTLLLETNEEQTTRLISGGSDVLACTSNLAKIYRLSNVLNSQGTYESDVKDTQTTSSWGQIYWKAEVPNGATQKVYTRSGNTKKPDKTWSDWSKAYTNPQGELIQSPQARYIQFKLVLTSSGTNAVTFREITLPYLPQNLPPEVKTITILPPGVAFQKQPGVSMSRNLISQTDQSAAIASGASEAISSSSPGMIPPRRVYQKGAMSFTWEAEDPNQDELVFSIFFRGENESEWKPLKEDVDEKYFTLEADTLPDGKYQVRITADDAPSNPRDLALSGSLISQTFDIDNIPPQVEVLSQTSQNGAAVVRFKGTDPHSPLRRAEVSVDGKEWEIIFSVDGIVDSRIEEFEIKVEKLDSGEHFIALRIYDFAGNIGMGKAVFQVK